MVRASRPRIRIGRSLAGLGLFACEPIKKGRYIARYSGRKIDTAKADELNNKYLFEINSRWTIDGASRRNTARYINHSCRPNAEVYFVGHAIKIWAIRNIKSGDEITYHYGRNYVEAFIKPEGCRCLRCARRKARTPRARSETHPQEDERQRSRPRLTAGPMSTDL